MPARKTLDFSTPQKSNKNGGEFAYAP